MKTLITLVGLVFILEGLPYVIAPEGMKHWLAKLLEMRAEQLRITGVITMISGYFLCYLAQKSGMF
ncbi:MAG: hypothetical protein CSA31_01760 [Desulfobulbus propionicus]|nr:MAG: hypothetical protein CSA31_01760 [Desulfobulbus propionicus]